MDRLFATTLLKLVIPVFIILLVLFVTKMRGLSRRDNLGLQRPGLKPMVGFMLIWLVWLALTEIIINTLHLEQAKPWPDYPTMVLLIRILAIGLLGPIAEELVMRGVLFDRIMRSRLGIIGAILITAFGWAAMHYTYQPTTIALIAVDGIILGYARYRSGSLWVPIAMHVIGNLLSIGQSLTM